MWPWWSSPQGVNGVAVGLFLFIFYFKIHLCKGLALGAGSTQGCQAWGKEGLGTPEGFPACSGSSQGPAVHICIPEGCWMLQASGRCCPCTEGVSQKLGGAVRSHWQHAATAPGKNPAGMDF